MDYEKDKKSFLDQLRLLDEKTKRKVVIATTAVLMIGVVYVWLGYFNGFVVGGQQQTSLADQAQQGQASQAGSATAAAGNSGLLQSMKNGIAAIGSGVSNFIASIAAALKQPGQYNIQPSQQ